ncbi:MAG TPA: type II toxin-antitoxin system RelE/ParE family toxin [Gaiellaceae bacterium]|nr:type II toxin-antitoxin system RelE/ParE family toxin [Gaiellaceae bacterium]
MARIVVSPTAENALARLIDTHSLPPDTKGRFKRSVAPLADFPQLGRPLEGGGYDGLRFVLGPWRWMVVLYEHDGDADVVRILLVEDARSSTAATNWRA